MTAKEYLQQIRKRLNEIKKKESEIFMLECLATGTTAPTDKEAVQTSGVSDKVGNVTVKIIMMQNEIRKQKAEALEQISECISVIERVRELPCRTAELQYTILHERYISFKKLKQIAAEECYDYDYIRELHGTALKNAAKFMPINKVPTQTHIL